MRLLASVLLVLVLAATQSARADSCPCGPVPGSQDALHAASAVFEGRVEGLSFLKSEPSYALAQMQVVRTWKGVTTERTTVQSPQVQIGSEVRAACTFAFEPGQSYLVYAVAREDGQLETSVCGRTRAIEHAEDDLRVLGMGSAPVEPQAATPAVTPSGDAANTADQQPEPSAAAQGQTEAEGDEGARREPPAQGGCASCNVVGHRAHHPSTLWVALGVIGLAVRSQRRRRR